MFTRDSNGALQYETNNYTYSLLEGIDDKGYTSDIIFIYRDAKQEYDEEGNDIALDFGTIVGWCYGAFRNHKGELPLDELSYIEERIKEYEKKIKGDVNNG